MALDIIGRRRFAENTRITPTALERIGSISINNLFSMFYRLLVLSDTQTHLQTGEAGWLGGGGAVTYLSGDRSVGATVRAAAGLGLYRTPGTFDDPEGSVEPMVIAVGKSQVLAPSDATHPRIDRIFAKPAVFAGVGFIDVIDPVTKNITNEVKPSEDFWNSGNNGWAYAAGTPAAVPTAPATPSGFTLAHCIAEIRVEPGSGTITADKITDMRKLFEVHPTMVPGVGALLANMIGVSAPLLDAHVQAALERLDGEIGAIEGDRGLLYHGGLAYTNTGVVTWRRGSGRGGTNAVLAVEIDGAIVVKSDADLQFNMATHLDAAEAPSTWYYLYVSNSGGAMVPHISATAPVLPGAGGKVGYHPTNTGWRYIAPIDQPAAGAVYNDASSNIVPFLARGDEWHLRDAIPPAWRVNLGTSEPTVYAAIALAGAVPAVASEALVCVHGQGLGPGGASDPMRIWFGSGFLIGQTAATTPSGHVFRLHNVQSNSDQNSIELWLPLDGSRQAAYGFEVTTGSLVELRLEVLGWR